MKKIMFIALTFLLLGCGTLNKGKLFSKNITKETLTKEISEKMEVQQAINIRDSTNKMMELTIWPKGSFTFSPSAGFAGEAFKIEMRGKQSIVVELSKLTLANSKATTRLNEKTESAAKRKEKNVKREVRVYEIGFLLLLMLIFIFIFLRKRFFFNFR